MHRVVASLFFASSVCVACGARQVHDDNGDGDVDAVPRVHRATLSCDYNFAEGLDLTTGEVRVVQDNITDVVVRCPDNDPDVDFRCSMARFLGLSSTELNSNSGLAPQTADADSGGLCKVGAEPPAPAATFDDVNAIDSDPAACRCYNGDCWQGNQLCGVIAEPYAPACVGMGLVVRDRFHQSTWAVRIVNDVVADGGVGSITFDYLRAR